MDVPNDRFTVTTTANGASDDALIQVIEKLGFEARVARPGARVASDAAAGPSAAKMPAIVKVALDRARRERKLVLVDFYAEWCMPCERMLNTTFKDARVMAELKRRFILLQIDTDAHPAVSRAFRVSGIPDVRILDPDGRQLDRLVGYHDAKAVLRILQAAGRPAGE